MPRPFAASFTMPFTGPFTGPFVVGLAIVLAACGSSASTPAAPTGAEQSDASPVTSPVEQAEQRFPDVIDASATERSGVWDIAVTISSPYDTPQRYADAWRVLGPDGTEYGIRVLTHDHAAEQPFTRSLSGVAIPDDVDTITIQGRDLEFGWGGSTIDLDLP